MRIDLYTKVVLTVIAACLLALTLKTVTNPQPVQAQSGTEAVQFNAVSGGFWFYDTKSGHLWAYDAAGGPTFHFRMKTLGQRMEHLPLPGELGSR